MPKASSSKKKKGPGRPKGSGNKPKLSIADNPVVKKAKKVETPVETVSILGEPTLDFTYKPIESVVLSQFPIEGEINTTNAGAAGLALSYHLMKNSQISATMLVDIANSLKLIGAGLCENFVPKVQYDETIALRDKTIADWKTAYDQLNAQTQQQSQRLQELEQWVNTSRLNSSPTS